MTVTELEVRESEAREQLFRLRFQVSMGQSEGIRRYRSTRKDLARILTVVNEKRTAAPAAATGGDDA